MEVAFREHGLVVWSGYGATVSDFDSLARSFTRDYFYGYGRAPFADHPAVTTVNETQLALEPHCDNGIRPEAMRPEITWFWCERPASAGGETTFHDGIAVWERLSATTRARFLDQPVAFLSRVAEPAWRALGHVSVESFRAFLASIGARACGLHADGTVDVEVQSSAVRTPRWSTSPAFVSSLLLAGSRGFEAMRAVFADGTSIPEATITELRAALAAELETVGWGAGDVGMLDNTRFLHGRPGFADPHRRVYLIQTLHATL